MSHVVFSKTILQRGQFVAYAKTGQISFVVQSNTVKPGTFLRAVAGQYSTTMSDAEEVHEVLRATVEATQLAFTYDDGEEHGIFTESSTGVITAFEVDSTGMSELNSDEEALIAVVTLARREGEHSFVMVLRDDDRFQAALTRFDIPFIVV